MTNEAFFNWEHMLFVLTEDSEQVFIMIVDTYKEDGT
jgi:hypothetical protein